ncbi:MtrAB system histidine kinase MtrB [Microcella frigidaquae]|uniref:Sensor histidine kinase MtrB n=1 Tax=Microcella frigidaquae TaxID=424758 RepID=A0A840XPR8_9MICO|nr:MtrAB system histidine kinase MtrB [Microcella frigidaquae]MBB5618558.1 two-component system sensor histidine kinase MtrB [Microcella frigidaquae]NHN43994.1 HAMP domain-containing histidine kinase [Microcella frigidaquae]
MLTFTWRSLVQRARRLWRGSLQLRTVAITVLLSTVAVTIISGYMSLSIATNLYEARKNQAIAEARQATVSAQELFDSSVTASGTIDVEAVNRTAQTTIRSVASSPGGTEFAILRTPGQTTEVTMTATQTRALDLSVISDELREQVAQDDGQLYTQAVTLNAASGRPDPGLVVGGVFEVPTAGQYELYLVYNVRDVQQTLDFVQQTLVIGSLLLVGTIGLVTYFVTRLAIGPVRIAAETAEKLAEGELDRRIPEKGEDVIATLARSFNRMADSLQRQITQLATLSRVQQRFVSDVSHELRTPLTTIRLAGDVLYEQRDQFSPTTARTAELLHAQVDRFESMLADLLEMSRYDAGAVDIDAEPTNLVRLVEESLDALRPLADEKGSELRLVAPGGYFEADVDARRIRRILQNLLGNAVDHGEGRPIVVHVDSDATAVAIAVRDYGVGMDAGQLERVFDRFWRADPSRQRTTGGTGLGLAIATEDAQLHGGTLDVWSEPGEGSCFRLTLPRERGATVHHSPVDLPPAEPLEGDLLGADRLAPERDEKNA